MAPPKRSKVGNSPANRPMDKGRLATFITIAIAIIAVIVWAISSSDDTKTGTLQQKPSTAKVEPISVCKVYIENSGSMDGYVSAVNSQLKTDLNALVSAIKADSLSANYINSDIIPIQYDRFSDFIEGLSVRAFQKGGGNRASTSLQDIISRVQDSTKTGEVSILVSDMILSLKSGQSPESVSTNIETSLRRQLEQRPDWSIVVWRMLSDYEGKYYHNTGVAPVNLSGVKRPYFIFFMGDRQDLLKILGKDRLPSNLIALRNRSHTLSLEPSLGELKYHIEPKAVLGSIVLDKSDNHTITEAERGSSPAGKQGLAFVYSLHKPELLQEEASLLDKSRYEIKPKSYQVEHVQSVDTREGTMLKIRVGGNAVVRGEISLIYKQTMPRWLGTVHAEQNDDIHADDGALDKTYGIRYILEGMLRPYESQALHLITMPITIK